MPLDKSWLETARATDERGNRKVTDAQLADYIAGKADELPEYKPFRDRLQQFRRQPPQIRDEAGNELALETALLNFEAYGTSVGPGTAQPKRGLQLSDVLDDAPQDGFLSRLGDSIKSVPERLQRGFGSPEVRADRPEVSQPGRGEGFLAQIADIPGDIADIVGPSLPLLGGMFGSIAGGGAALPTGPGAVAGAIAGAGAGGAAFEGARQNIGDLMRVNQRYSDAPEPTLGITPENTKAILAEGALNAVGEGVGQVAVRGIAKLAAPFKKSFNAELKGLYDRFGIRPTASMVSDSPVVPQVEALTKKSLFGGAYNEALEEATSKIEGVAQKLIDDIGSTSDPTIAGKMILEGADLTKATHLETRQKLYNIAAVEMSKVAPEAVPFDGTKALLGTFIDKKKNAKEILGSASLLDKFQTILGNLEGSAKELQQTPGFKKKFRFQVVSDALDELGKVIEAKRGLLATDDAGMLGKLHATMTEEFESFMEQYSPEAFKALKAADLNAAMGYKYMNGIAGQIINGLKDEPTKLVRALITPRSADRLPSLYNMVGPERVPAVQGAFLKQLLEEATDPTTGLTGRKLQTQITKYGEKTLEAALGPERLAALKDIQKMAGGLQAGRKVAEGSQTAMLAKIAVMAANILNPVVLLKLVAGDAFLSKFVGSPAGIKWLTEGFAFPASAPAAARAGGQAVMQGAQRLWNGPSGRVPERQPTSRLGDKLLPR